MKQEFESSQNLLLCILYDLKTVTWWHSAEKFSNISARELSADTEMYCLNVKQIAAVFKAEVQLLLEL